ncbi:MAG: diguanylate cyclase [Burkholderiales bacterium]|nr:diguanylate cyclase [Burkholderiales bacterium]
MPDKNLPQDPEALWKMALEAVGDSVWDWHIATGVEHFSAGLLQMYGYAEGDIEATPAAMDALTHPDDRAQMQSDREAHFSGAEALYRNEHRVRCKDGSWKWVLTRGLVIARGTDGKPLRMVGTHTDITARKLGEAAIWQAANFDSLTGLSNRRRFAERLRHELRRHARDHQPMALLAIDLDRFKPVNDQHGHAVGDLLLAEVGRRLQASVRELDMAARLGGDEFAVLMPGADAGVAERVAHQLSQRLAEPYRLGPLQAPVSASIGIALCPTDGTEPDSLMGAADRALYAAKHAGRSGLFRFHTPHLQELAQQRNHLAAELRDALKRGELRLRFQPVVDAETGRCLQAELLLRWAHPHFGELAPPSFLFTAEAAGLMPDIGDWLLDEAARWQRRWARPLGLSVKLGASQLRRWGHSAADWAAKLQRLGLPQLTLDLREPLLHDPALQTLLHRPALRAAGLTLALDDFGADTCSLDSLSHPGLCCVKLAPQRVGLAGSPTGDAWLRCVSELARAHDLQVIAKGVPHAAAGERLRALGAQALLGPGLTEAMDGPGFEAWWTRHS